VVKNFLKAHVETIQWIAQNATEAQTITNVAIKQITQASLAPAVISAAWGSLSFTYEPLGSALNKAADDAYKLKFLDSQPDLSGIYVLDPLNSVLKDLKLQAVIAQ
jgi:NitT/TauT family transport system substrate-binding protein